MPECIDGRFLGVPLVNLALAPPNQKTPFVNFLSSNIRFLRKRRKLSQQQLADDLSIKRSNIAAYETKNVEPRLALIHELASYFSVSLEDFIITDLRGVAIDHNGGGFTLRASGLPSDSVAEARQVVAKVGRMLDGFRVFYEFKRKMRGQTDTAGEADIDNFLVFIDHMSEYNGLIEQTLNGGRLNGNGHAVSEHTEQVGAGTSRGRQPLPEE